MDTHILTLNPHELIEWCNTRRHEMGISKAKLSEMTNVPESTLDRILSGKNPEFRYSTVQPIVAVLLQIHEETPEPDRKDAEQPEYYYNTIEGYKLVVENKNYIIEETQRILEHQKYEIENLQIAKNRQDKIIEELQEHIKWMQGVIDRSQGR